MDFPRCIIHDQYNIQKLGLQPISDLRQINVNIAPEKIKAMLPPIIITMMPDESYHVDDGNHRLGVASFLKLPAVRAFVLS